MLIVKMMSSITFALYLDSKLRQKINEWKKKGKKETK